MMLILRRDKKHVYTFVYITIDKWFVLFFSIYFHHRYSNARYKTSLCGIWIISVLWWGHHRLTEGSIVVFIELMRLN